MACCMSAPSDPDHLDLTMSDVSDDGDTPENAYNRLIAQEDVIRFVHGPMIGHAQDMNAQFRTEMQDEVVIDDAFGPGGLRTLCCVFDGHGGAQASAIAAEFLPRTIAADVGRRDPKEILHDAFVASDTVFENEGVLYQGTTAMVVLLERFGSTSMLHLASVGDSRAVLSARGRAIDLAPLHTPASEDEVSRIQREGGFLARGKVNGMVAVTRSLGDLVMKSIIISDPYTRSEILTDENEFLVIACDGIWDVIHPQVAIDHCLRCSSAQEAADAILRSAIELASTDNLSCLVVQLTASRTS